MQRFLRCAQQALFAASGLEFDGERDRYLRRKGGTVRLVAPKDGFNSHAWTARKAQWGWDPRAAYYPNSSQFILHTKDFDSVDGFDRSSPCGVVAHKAASRPRGSGTWLASGSGACQLTNVSEPARTRCWEAALRTRPI